MVEYKARCSYLEKEIIGFKDIIKKLENAENNYISEVRAEAKSSEKMAKSFEITAKELDKHCGEYIKEIEELKSLLKHIYGELEKNPDVFNYLRIDIERKLNGVNAKTSDVQGGKVKLK